MIIKIIVTTLILMVALVLAIVFKDKIRLNILKKDKAIDPRTQKGLTDYTVYHMTKKDWLVYGFGLAGVVYLIGIIFYKSIFISLVAACIYMAVVFAKPTIITNQLRKKRQKKLAMEFKDALQIISSEISSGKSFSNIILEGNVVKTLKILYGEKYKASDMIKELNYMQREMRNRKSEADLLSSLSERSGVDDIANFVDVFLICRKQGGNLNKVIKNSTTIIIDKMEIMEEINTIVSQKKGEQKIMTAMPLGMILLLGIVAPDYMSPMYTEVFPGRFVMTMSLLVIVATFFISKNIMDIEV